MISTRASLTESQIAAAAFPPKGEVTLWDRDVKGFGVRLRSTARRRTFVVVCRSGGRLVRVTLGNFGDISLAAARERALAAIDDIKSGRDLARFRVLRRRPATEQNLTAVEAAERTALYRHWDASGKLLYVGISLSPLSRISKHRDRSHWFNSIACISIQWFDSREQASRAERRAIRRERPRHNLHLLSKEQRRRQVDESIAGAVQLEQCELLKPPEITNLVSELTDGWRPSLRTLRSLNRFPDIKFPEPVRIGRRHLWRRTEIENWHTAYIQRAIDSR